VVAHVLRTLPDEPDSAATYMDDHGLTIRLDGRSWCQHSLTWTTPAGLARVVAHVLRTLPDEPARYEKG